MISVCIRYVNGLWFGLAYTGEKVVASCVGYSEPEALQTIKECFSTKVDSKIVKEPSEFAENILATFMDLHLGTRSGAGVQLASEYYSPPVARVLRAAAAIPVGYITSYGKLAQAAGTSARGVGQIMARNPLYPIVGCHRVVGSDFSLVGYGGKTTTEALKTKEARLVGECKGFNPKKIQVGDMILQVYPAEFAVRKKRKT